MDNKPKLVLISNEEIDSFENMITVCEIPILIRKNTDADVVDNEDQ